MPKKDNNMKPVMSMYATLKDWKEAHAKWIKDNPESVESEESFDSNGYSSERGLYDAGGHPIPERFADLADHLNDEAKYRNV